MTALSTKHQVTDDKNDDDGNQSRVFSSSEKSELQAE